MDYQRLQAFGSFYFHSRMYGADALIRTYLGLPEGDAIPVTVPHGVDTFMDRPDIDLLTYEPIYLAVREDIAERVAQHKVVLRFPHPWLLLKEAPAPVSCGGTLFIGPPPSDVNFEALYSSMIARDYPKPWGVLIKDRGVRQDDFLWWQERGIATHTAGNVTDKHFYLKLRDALLRYDRVASPNISSAVIFAAALGKPTTALPDVDLSVLVSDGVQKNVDLVDERLLIRNTWRKLFSEDQATARNEALFLLGLPYLDSPEALSRRYMEAIEKVRQPVFMYPRTHPRLYDLFLAAYERGMPINKLLSRPWAKGTRLARQFLGIHRLGLLKGSDLAHYGIAGNSERLQISRPYGFQLPSRATPGEAARSFKRGLWERKRRA